MRGNDGRRKAIPATCSAKCGYTRIPVMNSVGEPLKMPSASQAKEALTPKKRIFGFTIQNIPTINLRQQYLLDRSIVLDADLDNKIHGWRFRTLAQPITVTFGDPDVYFSNLVRTTILGMECIVRSMVWEEILFANRMTHAALRSLKEESARSMAELYYNRLPAHVRESAALKNHDSKLWSVVKEFYRDIRNPLSHGDQLVNVRQESLRLAFEMFDSIYAWIDSWSDRNRVFRIMSSSTFQALK